MADGIAEFSLELAGCVGGNRTRVLRGESALGYLRRHRSYSGIGHRSLRWTLYSSTGGAWRPNTCTELHGHNAGRRPIWARAIVHGSLRPDRREYMGTANLEPY